MYSLSIFGMSENSVIIEEEKKDMNSSRLANLLGPRQSIVMQL